jgi:hypothetical protein
MKLKDQIKTNFPSIQVIETYPKAQWQRINPGCKNYKKQSMKSCLNTLKTKGLPENLNIDSPQNWHEFDALLAWIGGHRFFKEEHTPYGKKTEGLIYV